jgi:flavin reductase (DIM6/NTAB) family NADH-FMN oxidoreductase RutF
MTHLKEIPWDDAVELGSPYPYVLAVTVDKANKANIIGLGWWTFTSWEPKMIAISIGKERYSHECIEHCKEFTLCFPSEAQKKGAWLCGKKSGRDIDKFKETGFVPVPSKNVTPPLIADSTVAYECTVTTHLDTGDHTLYVGKVVAIHGSPDAAKHLYSIHYKKLISLDYKGNIHHFNK